MEIRRLTVAQALVGFLHNQYVERDGQQHKFFAGILGIFGHGNIAGIGQALQQYPEFPYIPVRNEQSGVHFATASGRSIRRRRVTYCAKNRANVPALRGCATASSGIGQTSPST